MSEERITLRLPADLHAALRKAAEEDTRSLNSEIIHVLRQWLAQRESRE